MTDHGIRELARNLHQARVNIGQLVSTVNTLAGRRKVRLEDFIEPIDALDALLKEAAQ